MKPQKALIWFVRSCYLCVLIRGWQNLGAPVKGTGLFFSRVRKVTKVHQRFANLWTPGTIQSSVESYFAKLFGGFCRNRFCPQNAGVKALNRCERVTAVQTQDWCFSKNSCFTASSQQVFADKSCSCSLALVWWEVGVLQCWEKAFFNRRIHHAYAYRATMQCNLPQSTPIHKQICPQF